MAVNLDYPSGATPLDADELASLIPDHINTQGELNEWEQLNIVHGEAWARKQRKEILRDAFVRQLHKQMFGETWKWAGEFRKSDKNIGVDWLKISVELRKLLDDAHYQIEHASYVLSPRRPMATRITPTYGFCVPGGMVTLRTQRVAASSSTGTGATARSWRFGSPVIRC